MVYSAADRAVMREGGRRLAAVLREVVAMVRAGVSTVELDAVAERRIRELGGLPSFLGYRTGRAAPSFPSTLCTSINSEVVHAPAVPGRTLQDGDIIGLDIGMRYPAAGGLCTDLAVTVGVGRVNAEAERLLRVTREALDLGIAAARAGRRVRDISVAVERHVAAAGFSVVKALVGHGVGRNVHEAPEVPNFVVEGPIGDYILQPGLVIAIEPMVNAGESFVKTLPDRWTVETRDRHLSAHFEHTVAVTKSAPLILTVS